MKLRVQHENGDIEVIEIVEPTGLHYNEGSGLWVLHCTNGREYFFTLDGYYDGYGQELPGIPEEDATNQLEVIQASRHIEEGGLPDESVLDEPIM
ncbi:MAG TPA: hypothetical protein VJS44_08485 [Pyrinomonadaceae bacterium]|nr:hypothetical protein [Pyrinomonadaceae bacterium]